MPVGSLGRAVDVRSSVLLPAALEHLHHLEKQDEKIQIMLLSVFRMSGFLSKNFHHVQRLQLTFSEYMEGELMGLITTMLGPAWVCTRLLLYRCRRECITLDSFKYCREARSSTRSSVGGFAWNIKSAVVAVSPMDTCN